MRFAPLLVVLAATISAVIAAPSHGKRISQDWKREAEAEAFGGGDRDWKREPVSQDWKRVASPEPVVGMSKDW